MSTTTQPVPVVRIDVAKDLDPLSDLKKLIPAECRAVLQLGSLLSKHAGKPVSAAAGSSAITFDLTGSPSWTTASGIGFSLKPAAKCTVTIADRAEAFAIALQSDSPETTNVQLPAAAGMTYVSIDLDFDIEGSASGTGTAGVIGISGKVSGAAISTLSFCRPVPSETETVAAVKMAFSSLVFPGAPESLLRMPPGTSCRMNFDGTLDCEFDFTYGLAEYKLSAPGAALVQQSIKIAHQKLTLPTPEIEAGVTGSARYSHKDHFGLIVVKPDAAVALLYLVRSAANESDESVGIDVGITATNASVAVDSTQLSNTVQKLTGSAMLAGTVSAAVTKEGNNLAAAASAKLTTWLSDPKYNAGLTATLAQQQCRTTLFNFKADLTNAALAEQSWTALLNGSIPKALAIGGFSLLPGSGLAEQVKRSAAIQFHFFNLFKWSESEDYFRNSYAELAADGSIRIYSDIGIESDAATQKALDRMRFHFSAIANEDTKDDVSNAEIDLNLETSEKGGDPDAAAQLAKVLGTIGGASLQPAIDAMSAYAANHPAGTLGLMAVLKPSAYSRLTFSPRQDGQAPRDQSADQANWNAIHEAAASLLGLDFLKPLQYSDWGAFNSWANTGHPGALPDRRNPGNPAAVPSTFWGKSQSQAQLIQYFFLASAGGMNLFEDLVVLAQDTAGVTTIDRWNNVLKLVEFIVRKDANIDYAKPIAAAILALAAQYGATTNVMIAQPADRSTLTAVLTVA